MAKSVIEVWWPVLNDKCDKALARWRNVNPNGLSDNEESAFEYGFELGFRVAKGEVFDNQEKEDGK